MGERERYAIEMQRLKLRDQKRRLRTWAMRILILLIVALICFCIFGVSIVQGDSMRPAYQDGDLVFMTRVLPKDVTYGDVVIIEDPDGKEVIKRIAGLPGDTITVYDNGRIVRNQIAVQEQDIIYSAVSSGTWPPGIERQQAERLRGARTDQRQSPCDFPKVTERTQSCQATSCKHRP